MVHTPLMLWNSVWILLGLCSSWWMYVAATEEPGFCPRICNCRGTEFSPLVDCSAQNLTGLPPGLSIHTTHLWVVFSPYFSKMMISMLPVMTKVFTVSFKINVVHLTCLDFINPYFMCKRSLWLSGTTYYEHAREIVLQIIHFLFVAILTW